MLVKDLRRIQILERAPRRRIRAVQPHAVRGLRAHANRLPDTAARSCARWFLRCSPARWSSRALKLGRRVLHVALAGLDRGIRPVEPAVARHAVASMPPRPPSASAARPARSSGCLLAEVVGLRRRLHLLRAPPASARRPPARSCTPGRLPPTAPSAAQSDRRPAPPAPARRRRARPSCRSCSRPRAP